MAAAGGNQSGRGNPSDLHPGTNEVRAVEKAVAALEVHREVMADQLKRNGDAIDGMRERLVRLEAKVDALPTKDWIGGVVRNTIGVAAGLVAIAGAAGALLLHLVGK